MAWGWMWIAVIVVAIIIEALTDQLLCIWFVPAAIVSTILDFVGVDILWQVLVFLVLSLVGIFVIRRFLAKFKQDKSNKTNIEAIVGELCVVTERIDSFAGCGQAKVKGQIWSARGISEDDVYEVGEILQVIAIEGVKLICKKYKER